MIIYIVEQYTHETRYENYQSDMLLYILSALAGKGAELPPRYCESQTKTNNSQKQNMQNVTKQSVKEMFLKSKEDNSPRDIRSPI